MIINVKKYQKMYTQKDNFVKILNPHLKSKIIKIWFKSTKIKIDQRTWQGIKKIEKILISKKVFLERLMLWVLEKEPFAIRRAQLNNLKMLKIIVNK